MRKLTEADVQYMIGRTRIKTWALFLGFLAAFICGALAYSERVNWANELIVMTFGGLSGLGALIFGISAFSFGAEAKRALRDFRESPSYADDPEAFERMHGHVLRIKWK